MMEAFRIIVSAALLSVNAVQDIRKKEIFPKITVAAALTGMFMHFMLFKEGFWELVIGCVPGTFMGLVSAATKGKAGFGDAVLLLCLGAWERSGKVWQAFFTALLLSGIAAAVLFIKGKRTAEIPFVPFVLAGYGAAFLI